MGSFPGTFTLALVVSPTTIPPTRRPLWGGRPPEHTTARHALGLCSAGRYHVAGQAVGQLAVEHDRLTVHDGRLHPLAPGLESAHPAGEVVDELLAPGADRLGVEHHEVGPGAHFDHPPVAETDERGGDLGDLPDAFFE